MQRALETADALLPGQSVEVLTPLMPMPLLSVLAKLGFRAQAWPLDDGGARVVIRREASVRSPA